MTREKLASLPSEGELFAGKYRIGSVIGVGGMATVLSARHLGFDQNVALKILLPDLSRDADVVSRFIQEGKAAVRIRSEHVVRMLDVGTVDGNAYLVMEYLDGKDLAALLRAEGPLSLETAVDLLLQACEAIGEAHALGIVHRDLKPANLFITRRADTTPSLKVLDFGISKIPRGILSDSSNLQTLPTAFMGSPQYMSPEQMASAAAVDARSDIWSLGTILHELLAGRAAFQGRATVEICTRVIEGSPTPLTELRPDAPRDVELCILRCLEKDPSKRYANVAELARALAPFGTAGARASAESIARVVEGALDTLPSSRSGPGSLRPTAAAILARPKRRARVSGYLMGSLLSLATIAVVAGGAGRSLGPAKHASASAAALVTPGPLVAPPDLHALSREAPPSPPSPPNATPVSTPKAAPTSSANPIPAHPRRPKLHALPAPAPAASHFKGVDDDPYESN